MPHLNLMSFTYRPHGLHFGNVKDVVWTHITRLDTPTSKD